MPAPTAETGNKPNHAPSSSFSTIGSGTVTPSPARRPTNEVAAITSAGGSTSSPAPGPPFTFPELEGRDVPQQLEILNNLLELENRIKDGAENLLEARPKENLRKQVESELQTAKAKIAAISEKMEQLREQSGTSRGLRKKTVGNGLKGSSSAMGLRKMFAAHQPLSSGQGKDDNTDKDDFRTALNLATNAMKSLASFCEVPPRTSASPSSPNLAPIATTADLDRARTETMYRLVSILQRNVRVRYEIDITELIKVTMPALADNSSKEARAAAYRLLRHAMIDVDAVERSQEYGLDWYIIRSLARDNKHAVEKEQVILLIRAIVEIGSVRRAPNTGVGMGNVPLSEPIMRALIAVAEHAEDPFNSICLETLAEIVLIDIDLVFRTDGMRTLLQALADGPEELGSVLATVFLFIVDAPRTRAYLKPQTDLEIAMTGITDAYGKGSAHAERMRACAKVVATMLRSWSGLMYLCMNDMLAIRAMIDTLKIPSLENREIILDMLFEVLNIKTPEWYSAFIDGRRLTMYGRQKYSATGPVNEDQQQQVAEKMSFVEQYTSLLVLVLTEADLLEALLSILEEPPLGSNLSRKATLLIGEILQIANRVLPMSVAARVQTLPRLFNLAADYAHGTTRIVGTTTMSSLDSFNRNRSRLQPPPAKDSRKRANSIDDPMRRGQRQVEQVKIKMALQIDDRSFQNLLIETQVMLTKDHTKWNFDTLTDLIEGPLLNPKRLEEAVRVSRFGRRLMSFFHPFSHRFSDIQKTKTNQKWVRLGCTFLTTLLASPEGPRFLGTDDFLKQITDAFAQLDPFNGTPASDPIFSKQRVENTLTYGYLEMLGTLSKSPDGIELMERFKIFTAFYHLSELRSREDLIKGIIENIDYTIDGHPRIVLSKALTSSYKHIRLYATEHLGQLIQNSPKANTWTLRLLLTQLYDPAEEVCERAVHFLEEACESMEILQLVVEMQPTLDHLGEVAHPLLLKFMSTPVGFRYLYNADYIDREMDAWFHERNYQYAIQVEVYLAKAFNPIQGDEDDEIWSLDGTVPLHFYGEMVKTELGCQVLRDKCHFQEFAQFIRQHGLESEDFDIILKLKSVLWAVGNIGATEGGLPFLEEEEIIPTILEIAEQSLVLSVRGTCFFVLGLISSTPPGTEILDDHNWEATTSPLGQTTGLCVPVDLAKFVSIPPWELSSAKEESDPRPLPPLASQTERDVMQAIHNLSNTVISNTASRTLARIKSQKRSVFSSIPLFYHALQTISNHRFRLPVRRYILDLFEVNLDPAVVGTLTEYGATSVEPTASTQATPIKRFIRPRRSSTSDGGDDLPTNAALVAAERVQSTPMEPQMKVVGFDA